MTARITLALAASVLLSTAVQSTFAQGVVSRVKVVSDKVEDVSSLEAWKKSFIKDGMTEQEKAIAIFNTVVKFRHQTAPPNEFIESGGNVHDPIKVFNVYGYNMCCCASGHLTALARNIGMEAQGWGINAHSVAEIKIDGKWGMLDPSLINYFVLPDKTIAGVMDLHDSIFEFLSKNPDFKNLDKQGRYGVMRGGKWRTNGPEALKGAVHFSENGWQPASTHAWGDTIMEFGGTHVKDGRKPFIYDYATATGYEVNIQLRPGEKITRGWTNQGLHVNQLESGSRDVTGTDGSLNRYGPAWGDLNPVTRVGNGTIEYNLPLADGKFKTGMLTVENIATKAESAGPAIHVKDAAQPATLIFRMPSSYVYLGGSLNLNAAIPADGSIAVSFSDTNGVNWKPLATLTAGENKIDLKPHNYRRYDYRLKFDMKGAGTGLDAVQVVNIIQNSTRALPALDAGENKIAFTAGSQEGTITVFGNMKSTNKNVSLDDFKPTRDGDKLIVVPITTPGDIVRVRASSWYRCYRDADAFVAEASFDEGKTWVNVGTFDGVARSMSRQIALEGDKIPAGAKSVQFRTTKKGGGNLQDLRIDIDYKEPNGGFMPIKITYDWDGGSHTHIAKTANENYTIKCDTKPVLKSITMEIAQ
ncbi:MAG: hypothetical protein FWD53_01460 [Phycisphaerales bacterium]|nr:hypothetical protein [Phycisphaerales bacterium]